MRSEPPVWRLMRVSASRTPPRAAVPDRRHRPGRGHRCHPAGTYAHRHATASRRVVTPVCTTRRTYRLPPGRTPLEASTATGGHGAHGIPGHAVTVAPCPSDKVDGHGWLRQADVDIADGWQEAVRAALHDFGPGLNDVLNRQFMKSFENARSTVSSSGCQGFYTRTSVTQQGKIANP